MRPELDAKLCKDFPNLYRNRSGDFKISAMRWGFPGDGWYELIRRLSEKLERAILALPDWERRHYRASQVKEKWGTLRVYMTRSTDEMERWINEAEIESERVCELCGAPGRLRETRVMCNECEKLRNDKKEEIEQELMVGDPEKKDGM